MTFNQQLRIHLCILGTSLLGVLARIGLIELTTYNGAYLSGVVWANFTACLIMGYLSVCKCWDTLVKQQNYTNKGSIPVYISLSSGFCGTLSSFSSYILEVFLRAANLDPNVSRYPSAGYGVMEFFAVLLTHLALSIFAFEIGRHFWKLTNKTPHFSSRFHLILESVIIFIGLAGYVIIIVLIPTKVHGNWRSWTFSCLFSPFAAYLRYHLSKLNPKRKSFPIGTFAVNIAGTTFLAIIILIQRGKSISQNSQLVTRLLPCHVLQGLNYGFCGTLTTVSTFVAELVSLELADSYIYGTVTILLSFALVIVTLGSYNWSVGLTSAVCS